jgi:hypothetical protein
VPPRWNDDDAILELMLLRMDEVMHEVADFRSLDSCTNDEQRAIWRWLDKMAAEHAEDERPVESKRIEAAEKSGALRSLIHNATIEFVLGKGRGRPPESAEDRRWKYWVHDATDRLPAAEAFLRRMFPERDADQIRERAIRLLCRFHGAGSEKLEEDLAETLLGHLKLSRKDPRRL